jgi:hypothetical protein
MFVTKSFVRDRKLEMLVATYLSARDGRRVALPLEHWHSRTPRVSD